MSDERTTLTFDCYGTLIDWETGLLAALAPVLTDHGAAADPETLLEAYARHEARIEAGPYRRYRQVLAEALEGMGAEMGFVPTGAQRDTFADSVGLWPPFPDSRAALAELATRYRLVVLSNVDDDLFARSSALLGDPFEAAITAQQVGSYKPAPGHWQRAEAQLGLDRGRWIHVAQSLFHDIAPARTRGISTIWVNRRHGRSGAGATLAATAVPDRSVPDLASLARLLSD